MGQQREAKLMNEWLSLNHPNALQWKRVRLGPIPNKTLGKLYQVTQRWADAIFFEDNTIHIVEAKMNPSATAFGQLIDYSRLFRQTPEFSDFWDKGIKMIFLTTRLDQSLKMTADEMGIEYLVYKPNWLEV